MPKPTKSNVPFELFDPAEIEMGTMQNDWYIVPIVIIGTLIVFTAYAGIENTFNVLAQFIGGIITGK